MRWLLILTGGSGCFSGIFPQAGREIQEESDGLAAVRASWKESGSKFS